MSVLAGVTTSHVGLRKAIHPPPQLEPVDAQVVLLLDMQIATHSLRLIASERARCIANVKSALIPRMTLLETKVPRAGAARDEMMANMAMVTINSIRVKPVCNFDLIRILLIVRPQEINGCPLIGTTLPLVESLDIEYSN
jgi:hypothetical protein